jgi:hypothetical protein
VLTASCSVVPKFNEPMKTLFLSLLAFMVGIGNVCAQSLFACEGRDKVKEHAFVFIIGQRKIEPLSVNAIVEYGFKVAFVDSTIEVISFVLSYDCQSGDVSTKTYMSPPRPGDKFLEWMRPGNTLVVDCINVRKQGKLLLAEPIHYRGEN